MKPNIKKLLILNAPYLLFVYLFDKVGQAVRLSPGADLSGKLLSIGSGFSAAFSNALPSFIPADLLIGIIGAVIIRLAVYLKGKNAKKYRKGMEYGSARWGNAEDIKPYIDPVFENNVLLTQTERLMMSSRPKHPKYARNKNVLVIGGSGSGKTRFFVNSVADSDMAFRIHLVLHRLEEPYKEVFQLRVFGELSFSQIAAIFGKTESWARVTYHRAKLKIQERMDEKHE